MAPLTRLSTIACGDRGRSASGAGARESAAPLWQLAQLCVNTAAPSGDWADASRRDEHQHGNQPVGACAVMEAKCTPAAEPAALNLQPPL
jgi:hypothetical protein